MNKCKEYEETVWDYVNMASDNAQLQTAYQQGMASLDSNQFYRRHQYKQCRHRNSSCSYSGEWNGWHKKTGKSSKCKQCDFEQHTNSDGTCPALNALCGFCDRTGHYESACITKHTCRNQQHNPDGTDTVASQQQSTQQHQNLIRRNVWM